MTRVINHRLMLRWDSIPRNSVSNAMDTDRVNMQMLRAIPIPHVMDTVRVMKPLLLQDPTFTVKQRKRAQMRFSNLRTRHGALPRHRVMMQPLLHSLYTHAGRLVRMKRLSLQQMSLELDFSHFAKHRLTVK